MYIFVQRVWNFPVYRVSGLGDRITTYILNYVNLQERRRADPIRPPSRDFVYLYHSIQSLLAPMCYLTT